MASLSQILVDANLGLRDPMAMVVDMVEAFNKLPSIDYIRQVAEEYSKYRATPPKSNERKAAADKVLVAFKLAAQDSATHPSVKAGIKAFRTNAERNGIKLGLSAGTAKGDSDSPGA